MQPTASSGGFRLRIPNCQRVWRGRLADVEELVEESGVKGSRRPLVDWMRVLMGRRARRELDWGAMFEEGGAAGALDGGGAPLMKALW